MKIRLPLPLRSALLAACAAASLSTLSGAVVFENYEHGATGAFREKYGEGPSYTIEDELHFRNNHGSEEPDWYGSGALYVAGDITFRNCGKLEMSGNYAARYNAEGVSEEGRGGFLFAVGQVIFEEIDRINMNGNYCEGEGGVSGGAICTWPEMNYDEYAIVNRGDIIFRNCGDVEITGNYVRSTYEDTELIDSEDPHDSYYSYFPYWASGGAMDLYGDLIFEANDRVVIRGNYATEKKGDGEWHYLLDAFFSYRSGGGSANLKIKVREGQSFECYDSGWINGVLYINGDKEHLTPGEDDANRYCGTVTFSGKYTKEDLEKIMGRELTAREIEYGILEASRCMHVWSVQVCDGTLVLEDGAIMYTDVWSYMQSEGSAEEYEQSSGGFYVGDAARLVMKDAVIYTEETLEYRAGNFIPGEEVNEARSAGEALISTASFSGANTIYAHTLESTGGTWTFNVSERNLTEPLITLKFHVPHEDMKNGEWINSTGLGTFMSREGTVFDIEFEGTLAAGKYKLLEFDRTDGTWEREAGMPKITGKASSETVGDTAGSGDVYLSADGDTVTLIYDVAGAVFPEPTPEPSPEDRQPTTLTWGNGNGTWADSAGNGEGHWSGSVEDKNFYTGDSVVFSSAAEVNISGTVRPKDILVNNASGTVRFMGSGQITDVDIPSSQVKLTKEGAGTLEINTDNAYTGGTELKAGKLVVGNTGALGLGAVTVSGGTLDMGSKALTNELHIAGTATVENGGSYAGKLVLDSGTLNGALNLAQDAELKGGTVAGVLSGNGGVAVNGDVTLSGTNTYTGGTAVRSGKLTLGETGGITGEIGVEKGATLEMKQGSTYTGNITLNEGSALLTPSGIELGAQQGLTLKNGDLKNDVTLKGGRLTVGVAGQKITGNLTLNGGVLDLVQNNTLRVTGDVSTGEETTYFGIDLSALNTQTRTDDVTLELIHYDGDGSGIDVNKLEAAGLQNARKEFTNEDNSLSLILHSAKLTWDKGKTGVWKNGSESAWQSADSEWEDKTFHDFDSVTFNDAGDVPIEGDVMPRDITVTGDGDTTFKDAAGTTGSITGSAPLTKTDKGTLTIETDNSGYTGDITVNEGTLKAGHENAFGSGNVVVNGATFDANHNNIAAPVTLSGTSVLRNAGSIRTVTFASGSKITGEGGFTLASGNTLTIGSGGSAYTGDFTFGGGTLALTGGVFDLTGATSISASGDPSRLDLRAWEGLVYGKTYTLVSGNFDADLASALKLSALSDPDMLGKAHIEVRDGEIVLVIDRLDGTSHIGAELATAISSQTEGNMAHLRRLRGAIGSGQTISTKNRVGAYITGYAENNRLDQDAQGRGYHRTEIGGTLGLETAFKDDQVVLGVALSAGRANISPSGSAPRYHEDITREDLYLVTKYKRLRSTTSVGIGQHDFNLRRALGNGTIASAKDVSGNSVNLGEEIAVILSATEKQSYETFFAVESSYNHIDSFREGGNQSLSVDSHDAWATDLSLGMRANFLFPVVSSAPSAVFSVQGAVITSVGDTVTDVTMRYAGAPDQPYSLRSAKRNRWGYSVGASLSVPVTPNAAIISSSECILRGDSHEVTATLGAKLAF